jgi:hypothetical protein
MLTPGTPVLPVRACFPLRKIDPLLSDLPVVVRCLAYPGMQQGHIRRERVRLWAPRQHWPNGLALRLDGLQFPRRFC